VSVNWGSSLSCSCKKGWVVREKSKVRIQTPEKQKPRSAGLVSGGEGAGGVGVGGALELLRLGLHGRSFQWAKRARAAKANIVAQKNAPSNDAEGDDMLAAGGSFKPVIARIGKRAACIHPPHRAGDFNRMSLRRNGLLSGARRDGEPLWQC
jgi:hypothetical protein